MRLIFGGFILALAVCLRSLGLTFAAPLNWDEAPDLLTPAECARILRLGRTSTYDAIRGGFLKPIAVRWNRKYLIPKSALRRLVEGEDA